MLWSTVGADCMTNISSWTKINTWIRNRATLPHGSFVIRYSKLLAILSNELLPRSNVPADTALSEGVFMIMTLKRHTLIPQRMRLQIGVWEKCTICSCYWSKLRGHRWQVTATYLHDIDDRGSSRPPATLRNGPCCLSFTAVCCESHYAAFQETQVGSTGKYIIASWPWTDKRRTLRFTLGSLELFMGFHASTVRRFLILCLKMCQSKVNLTVSILKIKLNLRSVSAVTSSSMSKCLKAVLLK